MMTDVGLKAVTLMSCASVLACTVSQAADHASFYSSAFGLLLFPFLHLAFALVFLSPRPSFFRALDEHQLSHGASKGPCVAQPQPHEPFFPAVFACFPFALLFPVFLARWVHPCSFSLCLLATPLGTIAAYEGAYLGVFPGSSSGRIAEFQLLVLRA